MAMAYAQLSQAVSLLIATFCYICRQVLRVFARRDADRNTGDNFKQQVVTARYLTALLDQGIAIQHEGPLEEADDQCLGELATLVIKAKELTRDGGRLHELHKYEHTLWYTTIGWLLQAKQAAEEAACLIETLQASIDAVKEQPGGGSQVMQHIRRLLEAAELARGGAADPEQGPP